jgi:hypothetical protein
MAAARAELKEENRQLQAQVCPELARATLSSGFSAAMEAWKSVLAQRLYDDLPRPVRDLLKEHGTDVQTLIGLRLWVERRGLEATLSEMRKAVAATRAAEAERLAKGLPYE